MDIGIRLHDTKPGTLRERLGYASAQGFTCVQLAMGKAIPDFRMAEAPRLLTEDLAAEVREELEKAGITCAVLGCYLKLSQAEGEEADRVREIYRAHLRFARWIGAGCVGTETPPVTCPEGEACRTEEQFRLFLERARPLAREAEELGMTLAVEPVCTHIVHDAAAAERMLAELDSPNVKIILDAVNLIDSGHTDRTEEMIEDAIRRLGPRVCVLHMKDFIPAPGEPRPKPVPCGQGQMRYGALLDLAKKQALPMTLENTTPENAEETRRFLEKAAKAEEFR